MRSGDYIAAAETWLAEAMPQAYNGTAPEGIEPACVFWLVSAEEVQGVNGDTLLVEMRFRVGAWARKPSEAKDAYKTMHTAIDAMSGDQNGWQLTCLRRSETRLTEGTRPRYHHYGGEYSVVAYKEV